MLSLDETSASLVAGCAFVTSEILQKNGFKLHVAFHFKIHKREKGRTVQKKQ